MSDAKCGWCGEEMSSSVTTCAKCGKLRKDIYSEKVIYYSCLGISTLFLIISMREARNPFSGFSLKELVTSIWFILFVLAAIATWIYYFKVSKKIGTWWWV
jgi:hypothetical protein